MKVRAGFVSNSSSSSFCIFGCKLTDELFEILKKKALEIKPDLCDSNDPGVVCWSLGLKYYPSYDSGKVVGLTADDSTIDELVKLQEKLIGIIGEGFEFRVISGEWAD